VPAGIDSLPRGERDFSALLQATGEDEMPNKEIAKANVVVHLKAKDPNPPDLTLDETEKTQLEAAFSATVVGSLGPTVQPDVKVYTK